MIELLRKKHKGKLCAFKLESGLTDNKLIEKGKTLLKNADIVVANHSEVLGDENTKLAIITKKDNIWIEDTKINASKQIRNTSTLMAHNVCKIPAPRAAVRCTAHAADGTRVRGPCEPHDATRAASALHASAIRSSVTQNGKYHGERTS